MAESSQTQVADLTGLAFAFYQEQQKQLQLQQQQQKNHSQLLFHEAVDLSSTIPITSNSDITLEKASFEEEVGEGEQDEIDEDELLINEVRSFRCLWDTKCRAYKDTPKKTQAWKSITTKLRKPGE